MLQNSKDKSSRTPNERKMKKDECNGTKEIRLEADWLRHHESMICETIEHKKGALKTIATSRQREVSIARVNDMKKSEWI